MSDDQAPPDPRVLALDELARKLRLTLRQVTFATAVARGENATRAAEIAGCKSGKVAAVSGCRWAKKAKIQEFVRSFRLTAASIDRPKPTEQQEMLAETITAPPSGQLATLSAEIMQHQELLIRLTALARADIGVHLRIDPEGEARVCLDPDHTITVREIVTREQYGKDENDGVILETRLKVADPLPALLGLAKLTGLEPSPTPPAGVTNVNVLVERLLMATPQQIAAGYREMLQAKPAGGNGGEPRGNGQ